jgi:predicted flavoprotein YhiN
MKVNGTTGLTFPDTTTLASAGQSSVQAWVNFNGTGTVAIRASYNVSSITDNGTGDYTVNFTNALVDADYSATATGGQVSGGFGSAAIQMFVQNSGGNITDTAPTTSSFRFCTLNFSGSFADLIRINVAIFR